MSNSSPFNENSFIGWAAVFLMQLIFGITYLFANIPTAAFFLAIGFYFDACTHYFHEIFENIREILTERLTVKMRLELKEYLMEAINLHNTSKKYLRFCGFR